MATAASTLHAELSLIPSPCPLLDMTQTLLSCLDLGQITKKISIPQRTRLYLKASPSTFQRRDWRKQVNLSFSDAHQGL